MKKYTIFQKVTAWQVVEIETEISLESLKKILDTDGVLPLLEIEGVETLSNQLVDMEDIVTLTENDGYPTIELFIKDSELVWRNTETLNDTEEERVI